jgi:hypothetical protein
MRGRRITALPALMRYIFLLAPLLSSLSAFRMYLIAAGSAVITNAPCPMPKSKISIDIKYVYVYW